MIEEVRPVVVPPPVLVPMGAASVPDYSSEADRQRAMLEQLRKLESTERERARNAPSGGSGTAVTVPAPASGLRAMLRNHAGLRQALMLREIVDPPLGLRPPESPGQGIWTRL
jgi:hypothetical protein